VPSAIDHANAACSCKRRHQEHRNSCPGGACTVVYGKSKSADLCGGRIDEWAGGIWAGIYGMLFDNCQASCSLVGLDRDKDGKADVSREGPALDDVGGLWHCFCAGW